MAVQRGGVLKRLNLSKGMETLSPFLDYLSGKASVSICSLASA